MPVSTATRTAIPPPRFYPAATGNGGGSGYYDADPVANGGNAEYTTPLDGDVTREARNQPNHDYAAVVVLWLCCCCAAAAVVVHRGGWRERSLHSNAAAAAAAACALRRAADRSGSRWRRRPLRIRPLSRRRMLGNLWYSIQLFCAESVFGSACCALLKLSRPPIHF